MANIKAVNFELTTPTPEDMLAYGNQTISETHQTFTAEINRLVSERTRFQLLPTADKDHLQASVRRGGDVGHHDKGQFQLFRNIKELKVQRRYDLGEEGHYAGILVLRSCMQSASDRTTGQESEPVPSLKLEYFEQTPRPGLLLREFGLQDVIKAESFDRSEPRTKEVASTGEVTPAEENTPEAEVIKQAFGLYIEALRKLPDPQTTP